MVSTTAAQYATDFNTSPATADVTKSPLAMLAKTCETIGLPDTPTAKKTPKKDESPGDHKKSDSPQPKRKDGRSPRATPKNPMADHAAALAAMGLQKGAAGVFPGFGLPIGFPMAFPGMMPYPPMPFPGFPMAPFMRCPSAMLGRPCSSPTCPSCSPTSAATSTAADAAVAAAALATSFPSMTTFPFPFMPSTSTSSSLPNTYQKMLQAAAVAAMPPVSTPPAVHKCFWNAPGSSPCNKSFTSLDELTAHIKTAHAGTPPAKSPEAPPPSSTPSAPAKSPSLRYHPYSKMPSTPAMPTPPITAPFNFPSMPFPAALQAMYQQRLLGMPHP